MSSDTTPSKARKHQFHRNPQSWSDFQAAAMAMMRADGLDVEELIANGGIQRVRLLEKRSGKDGSYLVFDDEWPTAWWLNYSSGVEGTFHARPEKESWTKAQKALHQARIREAKAKAERERARQHMEAAARAKVIWEKARPARGGNPYLAWKHVAALGVKQGADRRLIMPILDRDGEIQTLQFIFPPRKAIDPETGAEKTGAFKMLLSGGKKGGCFFPIPPDGGQEGGPLLIAEGYATCASLHMATGLETWCCIDAGNMGKIARLAREKFPRRKIALCADWDSPNQKYGDAGGTGVAVATDAAWAIGAYLIIPPHGKKEKIDFNDLHIRRGLEAVKEAVFQSLDNDPICSCPMPEGFRLVREGKDAGLYHIADKDQQTTRIGAPLEVMAATRSESGESWGLLLRWHDLDGRQHEWAMPASMLHDPKGDFLCALADSGWQAEADARKLIIRYLASCRPFARRLCVNRTGWTGDCYVLPDKAYGPSSAMREEVVAQARAGSGLYETRGDLESWRGMARLCAGNTRLSFALAAAFAGPLLKLCGMESGGFNFVGGSSIGKTTALQVAASVWGGPAHVRSWSATANALEVIGSLHNDGLICLDELSQASARALDMAAYMLANGQGKSRLKRDVSLRETMSWRAIFLSTGEIGLADKLAEDSRRPRAGQDVRMADIPTGGGHIGDLHGMANSGALIREVKRLCKEHYGLAGRAFLEKLAREGTLARIRENGRERIEGMAREWTPEGADGQVERVALRFALAAYAGELAYQLAILPEDVDSIDAARACFAGWLERRGGHGPAEEAAILSDVRAFLEKHGDARFVDLDAIGKAKGRYADAGEPEIRPCPNRAGFRETGEDGNTIYYAMPETFRREMAQGHDVGRAAQTLADNGWLEKPRKGAGYRIKKRFPGAGNQWAYKISMPQAPED